METIWTPLVADDDMAFTAMRHGHDLHHLRATLEAIRDGTLTVRLTAAQVHKVVRDPASPPLMELMARGTFARTEAEANDLLMKQARASMMMNESKATVAPPPAPAAPGVAGWRPAFAVPAAQAHLYTWHRTIRYRMECAHHHLSNNNNDKLLQRKLQRFCDAHMAAIVYLDSVPDPRDDLIDVPRLLACWGRGLGPTHYEADASYVKVTRTVHKMRDTPLEVIGNQDGSWTIPGPPCADAVWLLDGPDHEWNPFPEANKRPADYTYYRSMVAVLNRIAREGDGGDALWAYYVSFVDIFAHMIEVGRADDAYLLTPRNGDGPTPWELYHNNVDTRAFTAGDLPDLYHVLAGIPLQGEQHTPAHDIGHVYQKSLPFACQRRHVTRLVVNRIEADDAFWRVFSKLTWCLLADMYPAPCGGGGGRAPPSMRALLRAKELTDSKELLTAAIDVGQRNVATNGGPLVVFTIVRAHIVYMASTNEQYTQQARRCIDWDYFVRDTMDLAAILRAHPLFAAVDPFAQARASLSKTVKSPNTRVHRLRKRSMSIALTDRFNDMLEKVMLKDYQNYTQDAAKLRAGTDLLTGTVIGRYLARMNPNTVVPPIVPTTLVARAIEVSDAACAFYERALDVRCKSALLNALVRTRPSERMTPRAFAMMLAPELGGVSGGALSLLADLCTVYMVKAVPKEFRSRIERFFVHDFVVVCYYLNMVSLLENIAFEELDYDTTRRTHVAMCRVRHQLNAAAGDQAPLSMYDVSISLCCEKVCTRTEQGHRGDKHVAYNVDKQTYVCVHGKKGKKKATTATPAGGGGGGPNGGDDLVADAIKMNGRGAKRSKTMDDRKAVRNQRKAFSRIPCGQPVLQVSLYGRALVWGAVADSKVVYMFCPGCAALHEYSMCNFSASEAGAYRCVECSRKEVPREPHHECAYCLRSISSGGGTLDIINCDTGDVALANPETALSRLHFCTRHYYVAKRHHHNLPHTALWAYIRAKQERKNMLYAQGIYHKQ